MSAVLLHRAAERLRTAAAAASPGDWDDAGQIHDRSVVSMRNGHDVALVPRCAYHPSMVLPDSDYIALMHPPVAVALADWLEATAAVMTDPDVDHTPLTGPERAAVAVAAAVFRAAPVVPS